MGRMKRGLIKGDVNYTYDLRTPPGTERLQMAFIQVSFGMYEVEESAGDLPATMTAEEFLRDDRFSALLELALDTLNANIERFLDDLGAIGVIE